MAINGQACSAEEFVELIELVRPAVEAFGPYGEKGDRSNFPERPTGCRA